MKGLGKFVILALALAGINAFSSTLACSAVTATANGSFVSVQDLMDQGPCTIGYLVFDFTPANGGFYQLAADDNNGAASTVGVTIVGNGDLSGPSGFKFTDLSTDCNAPGGVCGAWYSSNPDVSGSNFADIGMGYSVSLAPNAPSTYFIGGAQFTLFGVHVVGSSINTNIGAGESITNSSDGSDAGSGGISITASNGQGPVLAGSDNGFQSSGLTISKDILMTTPDVNGSTRLSAFDQTFTLGSVPEPGPFVLAGAGLLAIFLLKRPKVAGGALAVLALFSFGSHQAKASPLCTTGAQDISVYTSGCTIGDFTFVFNGTYDGQTLGVTTSGSTFSARPTDLNTTVKFVLSGQSVQLVFVPVVGISASSNANVTVAYEVYTNSDPILRMTATDTTSSSGAGATFNNSTANVFDSSNTEVFGLNYKTTGSGSATVAFPSASATSFTPGVAPGPANALLVSNSINFQTNSTSTEHLSALNNTLVEAPEPITLFFLGSGLITFGFIGRRRRK